MGPSHLKFQNYDYLNFLLFPLEKLGFIFNFSNENTCK